MHLTRRLVVCLLAAAAVLIAAGCAAVPSPSASPAPAAGPPTACIGLDAGRCQEALRILAEREPGVTPSWVKVAWSLCDGPCPGAERGRWRAHLTVEYPDLRDPLTALLEVEGDAVTWEPIDSALVSVLPKSEALTGPTAELTLGHCGLASPIDVDGSLWDPIGLIDPTHPDFARSAPARFSLTSVASATLMTAGGLFVNLVRHEGPRSYPGCD